MLFPKNTGNKDLIRIAFIKAFLTYLSDSKKEVFVLDEVGFGTKDLSRYGYGLKGKPVVLTRENRLAHNMTCIATISTSEAVLL